MATIALDARLTRQMSVGMKAYVTELVRRLPQVAPQHAFAVFGTAPLEGLDARATLHRVADNIAANGGIGEQLRYPRLLAASRPDLVHYMSVYAPRSAPFAHVYTIHDLIHLRYPQYFSWKVPPYYRLVVRRVAQTARFVVTDAAPTAADLQSYLRIDPARVRVVPLGVDGAFLLDATARRERAEAARERYGLGAAYFVYAGNHRPHKNLGTLVEAWRMVQAPCDLVMTEDGPFDVPLDPGPKRNGKIVAVGHVSTGELVSLYAGCAGAVQPSLYEGFGLGALEAMSAGAPLVIARTPVLEELAADAAFRFAPHDAAQLARHLQLLATDSAQGNAARERGWRRALDFSWDRTARLTARVYEEALSK